MERNPRRSGSAKLGELHVGQPKACRGDVLLEVRDRGRARDRQHHRRAARSHASATCAGVASCALATRPTAPPARQVARRERVPGDEGDASAARTRRARPRRSGRRGCSGSGPKRSGRGLGAARAARRSRWRGRRGGSCPPPAAGRAPHCVLERDLGIGRVELVEVDAVEAQPAQAALARLAQVLRPAVAGPGPGSVRRRPPFVAMTSPSGYGCRASAIRGSFTSGP